MDCLDGPEGCDGQVHMRPSMSGSGMLWPRCDLHYQQYADRMRPIIADINRRYPNMPPDDFDPLYAGERWSEDDV